MTGFPSFHITIHVALLLLNCQKSTVCLGACALLLNEQFQFKISISFKTIIVVFFVQYGCFKDNTRQILLCVYYFSISSFVLLNFYFLKIFLSHYSLSLSKFKVLHFTFALFSPLFSSFLLQPLRLIPMLFVQYLNFLESILVANSLGRFF